MSDKKHSRSGHPLRKTAAGKSRKPPAGAGKVPVHPFNPAQHRRDAGARQRGLEMINEAFARGFRRELTALLQRNADVSVGHIMTQPYCDYAATLITPSALILAELCPLRGTAMFAFAPDLVFMALDSLFGGSGRLPARSAGKAFTLPEQQIITLIWQRALLAYGDAWQGAHPLEIAVLAQENRPECAAITPDPADRVVCTRFKVTIGALHGELAIVLPATMIEPVRQLLSQPLPSAAGQDHSRWRDQLACQVQGSKLELMADFAQITLPLSRVMTLQAGDIISIDKPDRLIARVEGMPVFSGSHGSHNGRYAMRIEQLINPVLNALNNEETPHE